MNKKRSIIIRNPSLRRVRNNFRAVILKISRAVQHELLNQMEEISNPKGGYSEDPELFNQSKVLTKKMQELDTQLYESILLCPACFKADKDMTYNPVRKKWYCTECYAELRNGFTEEGRPEEFP